MLRPLVFGIRSFLLVSVSLFRLNSSRRGTVTFVFCICLMFQMIDIGSLLMPISRPGLHLLLFIYAKYTIIYVNSWNYNANIHSLAPGFTGRSRPVIRKFRTIFALFPIDVKLGTMTDYRISQSLAKFKKYYFVWKDAEVASYRKLRYSSDLSLLFTYFLSRFRFVAVFQLLQPICWIDPCFLFLLAM